MSSGRIAYARAGRPCATSVCTPVQGLLCDQAPPCIRPQMSHLTSVAYTSPYTIYAALLCLVPTYTRVRELLAAGVLERRDKPPALEFQEKTTVQGVPALPDGYIFTQWLRCAIAIRSYMTIHPIESLIAYVPNRSRVHCVCSPLPDSGVVDHIMPIRMYIGHIHYAYTR